MRNVSLNMSHFYQIITLLLTISSKAYVETKDAKCEDATKICENTWYCKKDSVPDNYTACGRDGLVDRVCCDPKYPPTKCRKYCDSMHERISIDEYGNSNFRFDIRYDIATAALGHRNDSSTRWLCVGTLITKKFVLTTAKCMNQSINIVRLGDLDLKKNDDDNKTQEYGVLRHVVHPKYTYPYVYNDIAIIELNDTVKFTNYVKPICINDGPIRQPLWQEIGYKNFAHTYVQVLRMKERACDLYFEQEKFANIVPFGIDKQTQFCATSHLYHGECQTQVGAQLEMIDVNYVSTSFLIGITTIPKPCSHTNEPGLYINVTHYTPWIESIAFSDD